jgi:flavin-dependent dehydrogenase
MHTSILVVGAGPAGASTAWHLAQLNVEVTVVDRAHFPRDKVCAEYVSPQATRILAAMAALEPYEDTDVPHLTGMRVRAPSGKTFTGLFAGEHQYHGFREFGLGVRRTTFDALLVDRVRAAGVTVLEGTHVTDVTRDSQGRVDGVIATAPSGAPIVIHADLVVGADGLRSVVGRRLGLIHVSRTPRRLALVTHYRGITGMTSLGEMHVERDGYVGLADVGHGLTNVALVVPMTAAADIAGDRTAFLEDWLMQHDQFPERFAQAKRVDAVRVTGPFATMATPAWAPGAVLVGDAADFFDPFTGEGIYAALRGGELLAPFAAAEARAKTGEPLTEYEKARRAEFSGKWTVERIVGSIVASPRLMNHATRALARQQAMADLLIGVTGDFVPAREVLRFGYIARLLLFGI